MKNDHRSKFSNLSNWKEEAWKNQGFNGVRTRDLREYREYRCDALPTELWSHTLVEHRTGIRGGHGFEPRWSLDFFTLLLSNCLNWKIYCDDRSSLWSTTAVQIYELFHIYFTSEEFLSPTSHFVFNSLFAQYIFVNNLVQKGQLKKE